MLPQQVTEIVRIFLISVILSIGYAVNFVSIVQAMANGKQDFSLLPITYAVSSIWLCIACLIMVSMTLFGFKIQFLTTYKYSLPVFLFLIGVFGLLMSLIVTVWTDPGNKYIRWELESLYTLLPLYLTCLIYFFNNERFSQIINLTLFSLMLFITPFIRLIIVLQFFEFPLPQPIPFTLISSYASICFGTAILGSLHTAFLSQHYNSGLFIKTCLIASLAYYIITSLRDGVDFDKYNDEYRVYCYYVILIAVCVIYTWQIFIKGVKKVVEVDMAHIRSSPSFDLNVETMDMSDRFELANRNAVTSLLTLVSEHSNNNHDITSPKSRQDTNTISPPMSPSPQSSVPLSPVVGLTEVNIVNPNESIESIIKCFSDFKPCKKNRNKYFDEIIINPFKGDPIDMKPKHKQPRISINRIDRVTDSICAIVPFYNEKASEIHATLRSLYFNFEYIKKKKSKYKYTHFNVLLVGDGWFKADISTQRYLAKLYSGCGQFKRSLDDDLDSFASVKHKHNTVILQTKYNRKTCINPFQNNEKKLFLKMTTIIKIDNRKKANSHEWFLGRYGFAEWCKCDYMFFTDAYSTLNKEGLYQMMSHMKEPKNSDVVCCTGRARVYSIEQELDLANLLREIHREQDEEKGDVEIGHEKNALSVPYIDANKEVMDISDDEDDEDDDDDDNKYAQLEEEDSRDSNAYKWWENDLFIKEDGKHIKLFADPDNEEDNRHVGVNTFYKIQDTEYDHRLTINAHLRSCQMFEFEALYGTIGCYLLGGFLPVIPGPCGFYRSKFLLEDEVRGWYFEKINQVNDPDNIDLVLGNMKLAEDRILTISSILNASQPVRHSLIPEAIFYFDPMPNITQLMKQRRRWLNGSIATVIFVLRKISFSRWKVNFFRRYYVLSLWYMQLLMYIVVCMSPPLIMIISFKYGLATIMDVILIDHQDGGKKRAIKTIVDILMIASWAMFLIYIYFMQMDRQRPNQKWRIPIKKESIVSITLFLSYSFGLLTLIGTLMQMIHVMMPNNASINPDSDIVTSSFNFAVIIIEVTFFVQSFVLAPMVSKDFKTLTILLNTSFHYFMYSPFYVTYFFINALANLHDLSWGTRPDNELDAEDNGGNNPKNTTRKVLCCVIIMDIFIALAIQPFTEYVYAHIVFFIFLAFPSLYQIIFTVIWLAHTRLKNVWKSCKPKKMSDRVQYTGLND